MCFKNINLKMGVVVMPAISHSGGGGRSIDSLGPTWATQLHRKTFRKILLIHIYTVLLLRMLQQLISSIAFSFPQERG